MELGLDEGEGTLRDMVSPKVDGRWDAASFFIIDGCVENPLRWVADEIKLSHLFSLAL